MNVNGEKIKKVLVTKDGEKVCTIEDEGLVVNIIPEKGYNVELIPERRK